jgi:acetolactate synthase-1/2/3 large subunit
MGYSVPAAIGAKLACPDTPCVALAGDGAFLMTGLELLTAASLDVAIAVVVLRDHELAQIAQFQSLALGRKSASRLPNYDLEQLSGGLGVQYLRLDRDVEITDVIDQAAGITERGGPVVIDVAIDYAEKTYFTRGVVKTNFGRLPWNDRVRFVLRALSRRLAAGGTTPPAGR